MTPTKIVLEQTKTHLQLRVFCPDTLRGSTVIESTPRNTGKSLPKLRKHAHDYAERFRIPFTDQTVKVRQPSKKEQRRRLEESRLEIWRNRMAQLEKWAGKSW